MTSTQELLEWLQNLDAPNIAVDDGGLTLVALDDEFDETGSYYELGGIPLPGDMEPEPEERDDLKR